MSDRSSLAPATHPAPDPWDRVASELQALKQSQEEAYGGVDSALLGRFLAGECEDAERAHVEETMATHPELQQLADLVRDVLCAAPPIEESSPRVVPAPEPTANIVAFAPRQRRSFAWQRLGTLVAAACLFLVIGVGVGPLSGALGGGNRSSTGLALANGSASREAVPMLAWN
ncbi:MAG: hypothetical protein SNJ82_14860, partial [Gemmataceae bacterium]